MAASKDERDIAQQLYGNDAPAAAPDHKPVPLVPDDAPKYSIEVLVPSRPGYIGGTGPRMTKLQAQPPHKKKGWLIADIIEEEKGKMSYIVNEKNNPLTRVRVAQEDIYDWVSQRTLEDFSCKEFAIWEEKQRLNRDKSQYSATAYDDDEEEEEVAPRTTKKRRGRPKKTHDDNEEEDDEDAFKEVLPAKKDRAAASRRVAAEPQVDVEPSLSQPSLSQPLPNLKRKISSLYSNENTPGETADEDTDDVADVMEVPQPKQLSIRQSAPNSPQLPKTASLQAKSYRTVPSVQVPSSSPFKKQTLAAGLPQPQPQPQRPSASTRIIPGTPKPLFPIFGGNKPVSSSAPPRSTSRVLPPERKKQPPPSASKGIKK